MKFKGTISLLLLLLGLGAYVYFGEYKGKDSRQQQADAKKKAIAIDSKDITEISLVFPDHTITGVKKGEKQWEFTSPPGIDPDQDEWELLAGNVPRIEREDTVTSQAADLAGFGLKDPPLRVIAKTKDGKNFEILFGAENPRKIYNYAKLADSNEVFLSPSSWSRIFQKTANDLRNKKVLDFESDDIDSVTIGAGKDETLFQKSGTDWLIKKPTESKADGSEISTFISSIKFSRASSFADEKIDLKAAGLDMPAFKITLHDARSNTNRELLIGKSPEKDKYYAKDGSRPAIMIIEKEIPEKAKRPLFDWRDKSITATPIDREKTDQIEIHRGTEALALKKDGSDWKSSDGKKLQADKILGFYNTMEFDRVKEIIDSPKPLATYGLDKPKLEVVFKQGSNEVKRLSFGSDIKNPEGIYVKSSDAPSVKKVSKDVYDRFNVKIEDLVEAPPPSTPPKQ
jgi:hypothetical protein